VLGGLLFEAVGRRATFYAAAVLVIANALAMLALSCAAPALQIAPRPRRPDDPSPLRQLVLLVRDRQVGVVAVGIFAAYAAGGLFDAVFGVHCWDTFGFGPGRASLLFSVEPATYLLTLKLLEPHADQLSKPLLSAVGLGFIGLSLPLLTAGSRLSSVVLATVMHGLGYGFKDAVGHGLLADLVDRRGLGSHEMAFALADMADSVGYIFGPLAGIALCNLVGRTGGLLAFGTGCGALMPLMLDLQIGAAG
jgi:MFS family permease